MSIPVLRRPKETETKYINTNENEFMILTLKNSKKLVVSSDAYHGIIMAGDIYKCVICNTKFYLNNYCKKSHMISEGHKKLLIVYPHKEDCAENLIRQLDNDICYCSICKIVVSTLTLMRHLTADGHTTELKKAKLRSFT